MAKAVRTTGKGAIPDIGILVHPDSLGSELSQTAIGGMIAMV